MAGQWGRLWFSCCSSHTRHKWRRLPINSPLLNVTCRLYHARSEWATALRPRRRCTARVASAWWRVLPRWDHGDTPASIPCVSYKCLPLPYLRRALLRNYVWLQCLTSFCGPCTACAGSGTGQLCEMRFLAASHLFPYSYVRAYPRSVKLVSSFCIRCAYGVCAVCLLR